MDKQELKESLDCSHEMLSTLTTLRNQIRAAFSQRIIDADMSSYLMQCTHSMNMNIKAFVTAQEKAYRRSGGVFYEHRTSVARGMLRNG